MADQIKNQSVGEVSSPTTEEKMTAPKRKEPVFADPQEKNAPSDEGVVGNFPSEGTPERKLPVFKNDRGAEDGEIPPRREPIIKEKERKLPVFANEVKQHKDEDEFEDDVDFTSDSVAMPFASAGTTTTSVDISDAKEEKGKKKRKSKKEKTAETTVVETDASTFATMDQFNELSLMGGTMPSVVPFGSEGYLDFNGSNLTYVPTYKEENAIMAKHLGVDVTEAEPMPSTSPFVANNSSDAPASGRKGRRYDRGEEEAAALLADNDAEMQRQKEYLKTKEKEVDGSLYGSVTAKKTKRLDPGIAEAAVLLADARASKNDGENFGHVYTVYSEEKDEFEGVLDNDTRDLGVIEAETLLADNEAEKQRIKELKKLKRNKGVAPEAVVETEEVAESKEDKNAEKAENDSPVSLTEQKTTENNEEQKPAKVIMLVKRDSNDDGEQDTYTSDTADESEPKQKMVVLIPADNSSETEVVIPEGYEIVEQPIRDEQSQADPVVLSADKSGKGDEESYSKADARSERKAYKEALLAVAAAEKQKAKDEKAAAKAAKNATAETASAEAVVYGDVEEYNAPAKAVPVVVVSQPKEREEFSPEAYDTKTQKRIDKSESKSERKAEKEALLAVAAAEKQKTKDEKAAAKAAKNATAETASAEVVVYGDAEEYNAPAKAVPVVVVAQPKEREEFSPEAYDTKTQKRLEKSESKSERKAEKEALLAVAAAEKQKAKDERAAAKAAKNATAETASAEAVVYGDVEEYNAPAKAVPVVVVAQPKEREEFSPEAYDTKTQKRIEKSESKSERKAYKEALLAVAAAEKQKAKDEKAAAKAAKNATAETASAEAVVYGDFEPYYAPEKETPAAKVKETKVKAEFSPEAYDKHLDKRENSTDEKNDKIAFAGAYAVKAPKAEKPAPTPAPEIVYSDADYTEGYDPNWKANAKDSEIRAKAAEKEAKLLERQGAKAEAEEKRNESSQLRYESHADKKLRDKEEAESLILANKEANDSAKAAKSEQKAAAKAAKAAAKAVVPPVALYADFTDDFDQAAYDADKKAEADAIAQIKADAAAEKADKKAAKEEKAEAKIASSYDESTGEQIVKMEKKSELLAHGKADIQEQKDRKAAEKEAERAATLAALLAVPPMAEYADHTEAFDQAAYDADKKAEADAIAQIKADAAAEKAAQKFERAESADAKASSKYDKATDKKLTKAEEKSDLISDGRADIKEQKDRKAAEKEAERAATLAALLAVPPMAEYADHTEAFDQAAYDADKKAEADAIAQIKADAAAEKAAQKFERAESADAKAYNSL